MYLSMLVSGVTVSLSWLSIERFDIFNLNLLLDMIMFN